MNKEFDEVTLIDKIYRPLIQERLEATQIVPYFSFLSASQLDEIKNLETNVSHQEATKRFLDLLIHCGELGWYAAFCQALIDNGYEYLVKLLQGFSDIKDERIPKTVLRMVFPKFVQMINPVEVLPHLQQYQVIDNCDAEGIKAENDSRGTCKAAYTLFLRVGCKSEDWFPSLVYALRETKYEYIFKDYIPDLEKAETYEAVKRVLDNWIEKYISVEDSRPPSQMASTAREFSMSFDGTESEVECKDTAANVVEDESDSLVPRPKPKLLELRPYQEELIERGVEGKNALMVAPTGSGKTHMALAIIKNHLSENNAATASSSLKVAFFVPTRCLVWQQWKMCQEYLSEYRSIGVTGASKPGEKVAVGELLPEYDIIVMTPQMLVDALEKNEVENLGKFTLLIFDECHHAMKGHPYNELMKTYRIEERKRVLTFSTPKIIGLTASVGVGKATEINGAKEHILRLCANLDSRVVQVKREKKNLEAFVNKPSEKMWEMKGRPHDPFYIEVSEIMKWIEDDLLYSPEARDLLEGGSRHDKNPFIPAGKRGTERYKQWLSHLDTYVCQVPSGKRRIFDTCCKHLALYNDGLILHADARAEEALDYISLKMYEMYDKMTEQQKDRNDRRFYRLFKDRESLLKQISKNPAYRNPKLEGLKLMITRQMEQQENSRGIVFCRTRVLSVALAIWASDDTELKKLGVKAGRLTGSRGPEEDGGMTQLEQDKNVEDFKKGEFKILIATSVAQEGFDIPECNFVINYEHVTNEIARIQARGRGRAEGALHVTIGDRERGTIQRETLNKLREDLMNTALSQLMEMEEEEFLEHKKRIQDELSKGADLQSKPQSPEKPKPVGAQIKCKRCDKLVCEAEDLKVVKNAHHIVLDPDIWKKVDEKPHKKPTLMSDELWKKTKIHCKKCAQDWGIGGTYQDTKIAILKKGQALVYQCKNQATSQPLREWKDLPFSIAELTEADFDTYRDELQRLQ